MSWRRFWALVCLAALACLAPLSVRTEPAGAALELEEGPPLVALTFDDGPRRDTTRALLDGLALREVPATFFLVGERLAGREDLVRRMAAEGHQIGVHTYDHRPLEGMSGQELELEIGRTRRELEKILGPGDRWLRPPYGIFDEEVRSWVDSPIVLWSVDPEDWRDRDVERIVRQVLDQVGDGDIILMHDLYDSSVQAALQVVDALLDRGYCFVTVEQLLQERGIEPEKGQVCRRAARG